MKFTDARALVPIQKNLISLLERTSRSPNSLEHCRKRYGEKIVFSVYTVDGQDDIYGVGGRLVEKSDEPVFIDFYV